MILCRRSALALFASMPVATAFATTTGEAGSTKQPKGEAEKSKEVPTNKVKKILFVVTSHGELGNTGKKTGYWLSEVTHPWKVLKDAGFEIDFVSPKGGSCPVEGVDEKDPINKEFAQDVAAQKKLNLTMKPSDVKAEEYKGIFYAGGHGVMWDYANNKDLAEIARKIYENGGVIAAVCHGPAGLVNIKLSNGQYLVKGKKINSFTNSEEKAVALDKVVPYALETALKDHGAKFECSDNFQSHVVVNDRVITGQNPMSASAVGYAMANALQS